MRVRKFFGFALGGCWAGCRLRGRLMFSWLCVWVSVRRFFGFVLGGNRFLECNDATVLFRVCCCFPS